MRLLQSSSSAACLSSRRVSSSSSLSSARAASLRIFLSSGPRFELRCCCLRDHRWRCNRRRSRSRLVAAAAEAGDDDFGALAPSFHDGSSELLENRPYMLSSSEGEESDAELFLEPNVDLELPGKNRRETPQAAITVAAHRIASLRSGRMRKGTQPGVWLNMALFAFSAVLLLFVDWWAWRVVRLPLEPFYFIRPFSISAGLTVLVGYLFVPLLRRVRIHHSVREGPSFTTMGGLFYIPISLLVAGKTTHFSSTEVFGAGAITFVFLVIGLLDDILCFPKKQNFGLPGWIKFTLQIAAGVCFSLWFYFSETSSRYHMKFLVPLPQPLGLVYLGILYLPLTTLCFVSLGNGVNLTDNLDGLAGGISALSFIGMSVAVLPINPELSIFGVSMAGACFGFLVHNRRKASVSMGHTGSSALGGALAAMTACTGMFFPLFICSGTLLLERLSSLILQVSCFREKKLIFGVDGSFSQMAPFHRFLEYCGFHETTIVACFYLVSSVLCLVAAYVGLSTA